MRNALHLSPRHIAQFGFSGISCVDIAPDNSLLRQWFNRYRIGPEQPFGGARFFLTIMFGEMLTFGALVATGMRYRRRAEIHSKCQPKITVRNSLPCRHFDRTNYAIMERCPTK